MILYAIYRLEICSLAKIMLFNTGNFKVIINRINFVFY